MIREILTHSPLLFIPMGSLFLFLGVFLGAVFMAYGRRAQAYEALASLPLHDGDEKEGES